MNVENKLQELLQFAKKNGLMEMTWKDGNVKIAFRRGSDAAKPAPGAASAPTDAVAEEAPVVNIEFVKSPIVGTFRRSPSKGRPPMVMVGNHIKAGDPVGVVESMKIPTDVVSFTAGEIKEILVEDGMPVEYGQPLFSVVPMQNGNGNGESA